MHLLYVVGLLETHIMSLPSKGLISGVINTKQMWIGVSLGAQTLVAFIDYSNKF